MSSWWIINKLVHQSLTVHLGQDSSLIVISESSAHGLVVHVRLVLVKPPQPGDGLAVHDLEDPPVSVQPLDVVRTVGGGLEEGEEELPQVGVVIVLRSPLADPAVVWLVLVVCDWRSWVGRALVEVSKVRLAAPAQRLQICRIYSWNDQQSHLTSLSWKTISSDLTVCDEILIVD